MLEAINIRVPSSQVNEEQFYYINLQTFLAFLESVRDILPKLWLLQDNRMRNGNMQELLRGVIVNWVVNF